MANRTDQLIVASASSGAITYSKEIDISDTNLFYIETRCNGAFTSYVEITPVDSSSTDMEVVPGSLQSTVIAGKISYNITNASYTRVRLAVQNDSGTTLNIRAFYNTKGR